MNRIVPCGVVLAAILFLGSGCGESPPAEARTPTATNWWPSPSQPLVVQLKPGVTNVPPLFKTYSQSPTELSPKGSAEQDSKLAKKLAESFMAEQPDAEKFKKIGIADIFVTHGGDSDYYFVRFYPVAVGFYPAVVGVDIIAARRSVNRSTTDFELSGADGLRTEFLQNPPKPKPICRRWH